MALTVLSAIRREPAWVEQGVAEMDRAVALRPTSRRARLTRAFTSINLPPTLRNTQGISEDFAFLLRIAEGDRAADVMLIALGDLHAEVGQAARARHEYERADRPGSVTQYEAQLRLAALDRGDFPTSEVARLRSRLAGDCKMCHAE